MRIDSPVMTNAIITGSFSGSFVGAGNFEGLEADSVEFANVLNKPTLISSSAQITALGYSTTDNELTQEEVEDFAGALVATGGTKTGITVTYDDANGNMDFVVASQTDENFTTADHSKLDGIEASADVTDTTNVTAAGALMDSEVTNLATVKAFDSTDYATAAQGTTADAALPKAGGAMTGAITTNSTFDGRDVATDGTKLDGIEANATADQTDAEIRTAVEAATDSNVFTDADHTKLNGIEASADVTDTTIVTDAGALMDSECASLADVKALDQSVISGASPTFGTANFTDASNKRLMTDAQETKLDSVESNADVTDTTNVTSAGALMDSELTNLAAVKAINQGLATGNNVQFNDLTVAGDLTVSGTTTSINSTNLDVTDKLISINVGGADAASANGAGLFISGANESFTWDNGNTRFNFSDDIHAAGNITLTGTVDGRDVAADGTKLDGIESSATADQSDAEIRAAVEAATDSNVFTDADHSKLNGIEASATADQTAAEIRSLVGTGNNNFVPSAGTAGHFLKHDGTFGLPSYTTNTNTQLSNAEVRTAVEAATDSNVFTDADHTKLNGIEASADVTDTTNVTAAGALMDSECASLASVKAINQGLTTTSDVRFDSIGIGTAAPGTSGVIRATNDIVAFYSSDERLKDNIEEIPNA